jgi:YVTN family beta-propeller protein
VAAGENKVYVGLHDAPQVKVIDRANNTVVDTWDTKAATGLVRYANGVAISHGRVYVANRNGNNVSAILISNHDDVQTIPVGIHPFGLAAGTDYVFVANFDSESVTIINSTTLATNPVGVTGKPTTLAAIGNNAYVASWSGGVYKVGSGGSVAQVVSPDQGHFFGVAANATTARVYISDQSDNSVVVLDANTNTIVATISMPSLPHALAVNSHNNRIYIVAAAENKLYVLDGDTNQLVGSVPVGQQDATEGGQGIAVQSDRIYVGNYAAGTLTILDDSACQ